MDQKQLIVAAMQQAGLTSYYQLAQRLGVTDARVSALRHGTKPADEAEISMLAEMARIDVRAALAAVHKDREKNPAKRAYWEKISMQFAVAGIAGIVVLCGLAPDAKAATPISLSTNSAPFPTIIMGWLKRCLAVIMRALAKKSFTVNAVA